MASQDDEFFKSLLAAFAIEAAEHTQSLSDLLLRLEEVGDKGDPTLVEEIYREAHSLKGAARAVNLLTVENVCQALETVFSVWKKGQLTTSPELFDALHQGVDTVTALLSASDSDQTPQITGIIERLNQLARGTSAASPAIPSFSIDFEAFKPTLFSTGENLSAFAAQNISPSDDDASSGETISGRGTGNDAFPVPRPYESLSPLSFLVHEEPETSEPNAPQPAPLIDNALSEEKAAAVPTTSESKISPTLPGSLPPVPTSTPIASSSEAVKPVAPPQINGSAPPTRSPAIVSEETVRVATARLDGMLLQAEEMLLVKQAALERAAELRRITAQFGLWRKEWNKILPDFRIAGGEENEFSSLPFMRRMLDFMEWNRSYVQGLEEQVTALARTAEIDRRATGGLVDNLLEDAKKLLMLPFSHLMGIFPKMVRDLARHQEKELTLDIQGGDVQIDKRILEELKDPLIHLLRNSVDHGIETTVQRAATNKPAVATISLRVSQKSGSEVEVRISDDGRGINAEAVKASALKNGLLSPERAEFLTQAETFDLIFQSSLSTSPIITEISGRGLGMAIVREKVEKLGGHISVESQFGLGTTFCITLPLTLATFRGVLVEVKSQTFVLPATEVERVIRVPLSDVRRVHNRDTITLPRTRRSDGSVGDVDGRPNQRERDVLPFVPLADILELRQGVESHSQERNDLRLAVVLASSEHRIAFEVDAILSEQEVLVKPFSKPLVRVRNVAGATILASGKAVPILNTSDILISSSRYVSASGGISSSFRNENTASLDSSDGDATPKKSILVAEDSITSRMLLKNILESAGYQVTTAVDGLDAFTTLKSGLFDLVVSDVDMPRLNGLDLTAKIREEGRFDELPVILVTARSTREDRERGIDVGANAYIVKSTFNQNDLLEVVQRLI